MHVLLSAEGCERFLLEELRQTGPGESHKLTPGGLLFTELMLQLEAPPTLVFARQLLPNAEEHQADSVSLWIGRVVGLIADQLPETQPWLLHVAPTYGSGLAGQHRCRLIREGIREWLQRKRRRLLRSLQVEPIPFTPAHSFVQVLLMAPDHGFISVAQAPLPFALRRLISPFPKGEIPIASDKTAPSRAFAKLVEAELRLGRRIGPGETCVDLGASPGSWSYVALARDARVIAVDRAPLRADLMRHPSLVFRKGDAFTYKPDRPVDWLLCDVIAAPERGIGLLMNWLRERWAHRFVVTIKFKGREDYAKLEQLKHALPALCGEYFLTHLCANRNEACAFGEARR